MADFDRFDRALAAGDPDALRAALDALPDADRDAAVNAPRFAFGGTALIRTCAQANAELIAALLDAGADPNHASHWPPGPFTPLQSLPLNAPPALAALLIDRGAEVTACDAAHLGDTDRLAALLDARPHRVHDRGGDGKTPLHFARDVPTATLLLDRGADVQARCIDHHSTPAMYAATERPDVCHLLLESGATPDVFMAVALNDEPMLAALLDADPAHATHRIGAGPFAAPEGDHCIYLWTASPGDRSAPLHAAAQRGRVAMIDALLQHGADPHARGGYDDATPLHFAAWEGHPDAIDRLLDAGAAIDAESGDLHGERPAGWAVVNGKPNALLRLLDRGAERLPRYPRIAEAGRNGEHQAYANATPEDYERVLAVLRTTSV